MSQSNVLQEMGIAVRELQAGRLDQAAKILEKVLAREPGFADAIHFLGIVTLQRGDVAGGIDLIRRAVAIDPANADYQCNLGDALRRGGKIEESISACRRAIELRADFAEAQNNLGGALREAGRLEESAAAYREAVRLKPQYAEAFRNLGNVLGELRQLEGNEGAIAAFRRAIQLRPNLIEAWDNLGNALRGVGRLDEAIAAYRGAIEIKPDFIDARVNLAITLHDQGKLEEAVAACLEAIKLDPASAVAQYNLGNILHHLGRVKDCIEAYNRAIKLRPNGALAYGNLAGALMDMGKIDEALAACETAILINPTSSLFFSNLVYFGLLHPKTDAEKNLSDALRWAEQFERPVMAERKPHRNDRSADRRLKVGFVSPDFRVHPVGRMMAHLLPGFDAKRFEINCYSDSKIGDEITARCKGAASAWRDTGHWDDLRLASQIEADGIDVLVDLALHTAGNRLTVFARKPAPVQATWLGYPGTTGLLSMDYRLTDRFLDPPEEADTFYTEKSICLPGSFWCYGAPEEAMEIGPLPAKASGYVTFGCLNNFTKLSAGALELWAELMGRVPKSQLVLYMTPDGQGRIRKVFSRRGVEDDRIRFVGKQPMREYLEEYHRIDIALDPFPYAGATTTLDAMWMGVPTVTLRGKTAVGRGGVSILSNLGLTGWIAENGEEYISIAARMAEDVQALAELRANLRTRMTNSPLMDKTQFSHDMESAVVQMWNHWRERSS